MMRQSLLLFTALVAVGVAGCGKQAAKPDAAKADAVAIDAEAQFLAVADRHAKAFLALAPELATELGVDEATGGAGYLSRLGHYGYEAHQAARAMNEKMRADLKSVDRAALSGSALVTYDVLTNAYETAAKRNAFGFGGATPFGAGLPNSGDSWAATPYFVTQLTGPHLHVPRMLQTQHPLRTRADADAYLARLEDVSRAFDEVVETINTDSAMGVAPPTFAIDGARQSIAAFIAPPAASHPLATSFAARLAEVKEISANDRAALTQRAAGIIEAVVYPAYQRLDGALDLALDSASSDAGVWRLGPEGAAYYQMALDAYGAGGRSGEEIHAIGMDEVARITAEMDGLLKKIGLAEGSVGSRMETLAARPDNLFPNTDEGREALLASLREQVADINAVAPAFFRTLPKQGVEVRRIPPHEENTSPGGYYTGPSLDGSRPGVYWINLKDTADNPKHSLKTLTYHEAVPGHHFQTSFQRSIEGLPLMRNLLSYSEYAEGWALYAEALAAEMGMYKDDPAGDLGRLQAELFRAARLVVDTGLHAKRWTRDQAIDWMVAATGETRESITREVERYAVVPGQACAYKLGMLKIGELRAGAEKKLGRKFDLRDFHDAVLSVGDAPLPVLEAAVDRWIADRA